MVALKDLSNEQVIFGLKKWSTSERKITHRVLQYIAEVDTRRLYATAGFGDMISYLISEFSYSEPAARRRWRSAQLLKAVPEIADKLESGSLNLSQLVQVQQCIRHEQEIKGIRPSKERTNEILSSLENKSLFESEKILAIEFDRPVQTHQKVKPQKDDTVRVELTFTAEQYESLKQAQSLLSHTCLSGNLAEVIAQLAQKLIQTKLGKDKVMRTVDPVGEQITEQTDEEASAKPNRDDIRRDASRRPYISVHTKRALLNRAHQCCEYENPHTQQKCPSKFQLQIDHRIPIALGGGHNIENLRVLCRTHNLSEAERHRLHRPG